MGNSATGVRSHGVFPVAGACETGERDLTHGGGGGVNSANGSKRGVAIMVRSTANASEQPN